MAGNLYFQQRGRVERKGKLIQLILCVYNIVKWWISPLLTNTKKNPALRLTLITAFPPKLIEFARKAIGAA